MELGIQNSLGNLMTGNCTFVCGVISKEIVMPLWEINFSREEMLWCFSVKKCYSLLENKL